MRNCQKLSMTETFTDNMNLLKMGGPKIKLCLLTVRPIASKQLNSLTTIDTLIWLGGAGVTHPLWVREVKCSIPGLGKGFYVWFVLFCCCCVCIFCPKTHYLSQKFAISLAMIIYLVNLTRCVTDFKGIQIQINLVSSC